jgi:CheY-like chemotaxis protein
MAKVVAAIPDLVFRSKVIEAAKALSVSLETARDPDELIRKVREEKPRLVLLDLQAAALRPLETLQSLRDLPIVGFLAHEQADLRERALAAGCAEVLTKGQFAAGLPAILERAR